MRTEGIVVGICCLALIGLAGGCSVEMSEVEPVSDAAARQAGPAGAGGVAPALSNVETVLGTIAGTDVALGQASFDGELAIYEDDGWGWSPSLLIFLFRDDDRPPAGETIRVSSRDGFSGSNPHIHFRWREPGQENLKVDTAMQDYDMVLTFGEVEGDVLPGTIELTIPGKNTEVRGHFRASIEG